jgi:hypothetical protein
MESGATFKIVNNNNLDKKFAPSRSSYMWLMEIFVFN